LSENIGNSAITEGLLGLQVFTGVDSISAFVGKGKKKPFEIFYEQSLFQQAFQCLGVEFFLPEAIFETLERFVCEMYGQPLQSVNEARYRLFCTKSLSEFRLPPCRDALLLHSKRACYQAAVWRKALRSKIDAPSPVNHGWAIYDGSLSLRWSTQDEAPPQLMRDYACKCKKSNCANKQCSCFANDVSCTEMCSCIACKNVDDTIVELQLLNDMSDEDETDD